MMNYTILQDARVAVTGTGRADYARDSEERVWRALIRASEELGWYEEGKGPFARLIPPGARVVIKPNLVNHENSASHGLEPLITHRSVIHSAVSAACLAGAREVAIGDAPLQGCDFSILLRASGLGEWAQHARARFPAFTEISDFRRSSWLQTVAANGQGKGGLAEPFVLFDLGAASALEPITDTKGRFRVTCYDSNVLRRTHSPGRHQYLIAAKVLEADVVISLPKLKMHKKAGVTCAMKNLVGTCGDKAYLPHHRAGGDLQGGDCYPGTSRLKALIEYTTEQRSSTPSSQASKAWYEMSRMLQALIHLFGDESGIEGSWSGNDTVWRMCLDLNRILLYGRTDGTLADRPQRQFIHFVDAVIAGQGDGPLAPEPLPLGLVLLAQNAVAVDWVGALLLGYNAHQIPLVRGAFSNSPWTLADFAPSETTVVGDLVTGRANEVLPSARFVQPSHYPSDWGRLAIPSPRKNHSTTDVLTDQNLVPQHRHD